ncbi:hypothetical protein FIBSPDRAFT_937514 [Athelia psychrophila]|uniref:Uncharacterized protein n=1 Tax=Athelia psychrophila TaxID=1759441 RepID=A0A166AE56_9AGAM|nr:hypothetical protein FIBSPDRAFT_937514 [Fibularhizoctonia sp. CBS 109695]
MNGEFSRNYGANCHDIPIIRVLEINKLKNIPVAGMPVMSTNTHNASLQVLCQLAGFDKHFTSHAIHHLAATACLASGRDRNVIQYAMHHKMGGDTIKHYMSSTSDLDIASEILGGTNQSSDIIHDDPPGAQSIWRIIMDDILCNIQIAVRVVVWRQIGVAYQMLSKPLPLDGVWRASEALCVLVLITGIPATGIFFNLLISNTLIIGISWLDDYISVITKHTYRYLLRNGLDNVDLTEAAAVLNYAVSRLREDPTVKMERWAPFMYYDLAQWHKDCDHRSCRA